MLKVQLTKRRFSTLAVLMAAVLAVGNLAWADEIPLTHFVNPFIGTDQNPYTRHGFAWDTGNVFPGAVCPRGMLAWSPDTTHANQIAGGYWYPDGAIEDFSLTHFSGRGLPCLKDIKFMPLVHAVTASPGTNWSQFAAPFSHANETAAAGYYRVKFDNGIETELTATPRTGVARFTFPVGSPATLLIRADHSVSISQNEVRGSYAGRIAGNRPYLVYFVAQFDRPFLSAQTWSGNDLRFQNTAEGEICGAVLGFDTTTNPVVQVRAGISYVSLENAAANLAAENPAGGFETVRQKADAAWNTVLNRIQVEGGTDGDQEIFYTALYHCFMHPNLLDDVNGEYPGMDGKIHTVEAGRHQYQNIPAWDQHRSCSPLIAILSPRESSDIAQSLVNYAQQDAAARPAGGGLPRWEQVNRNSAGMVGDGDDTILAWSMALGANHFDTQGALAAMAKGASQPGATSDGFAVRQGLADYQTLGYVPKEAAVTLEYCNDDFALAQFAQALGDRQKYHYYRNRAQNWKNLFDRSTRLIRPRNADGAWMANFSGATEQGFVEGTANQYVWMVNFNLHALIERMGGNAKAVECLDEFFTNLNSGPTGKTAYMGNEPCEEVPWVYDFAGAPERTQEVVRRIQTELFTGLPGGLPGNDDAGALSSWYVFSALGLYPEIPGVAGLVIGSPLFPKATIRLENGAAIQIIGDGASRANPYVQSLNLNGRNYKSTWLPWAALSKGATLHFSLGGQHSHWGEKQPPPSFDTVKP